MSLCVDDEVFQRCGAPDEDLVLGDFAWGGSHRRAPCRPHLISPLACMCRTHPRARRWRVVELHPIANCCNAFRCGGIGVTVVALVRERRPQRPRASVVHDPRSHPSGAARGESARESSRSPARLSAWLAKSAAVGKHHADWIATAIRARHDSLAFRHSDQTYLARGAQRFGVVVACGADILSDRGAKFS